MSEHYHLVKMLNECKSFKKNSVSLSKGCIIFLFAFLTVCHRKKKEKFTRNVKISLWIFGALNGRAVPWASHQNCCLLQTQNVSCKYTSVRKMPDWSYLLTQTDWLSHHVYSTCWAEIFLLLWMEKCCENSVIDISALLSKQIHFYRQK